MFRKSGLMNLASLITILCMTLLMPLKGEGQVKLEVTNRLSAVGTAIGLSVTPDTTIKSIKYYQDTTMVAYSNTSNPVVLPTNIDGRHLLWAKIEYMDLSVKVTGSIEIFVATKDELTRLALELVKYSYKSQTFPDSLIQLPEHSLILGYTHYTTFKTLIKYLNPRF